MDCGTQWSAIATAQKWTIVLTCLLIAVLGIMHRPPGACFDDAGDLQTACATLGITHAPGYVGYAAVGWVLCKLFFFIEPATVVSFACLICITLAIGLCMVLVVRIGVHHVMAATVGLLLVAHNAVWKNLIFPEVYAPSLLLLAATTYLFFDWGQSHRPRSLYLAALTYGFLCVHRPPAALYGPFIAVAWWLVQRRLPETGRPCRQVAKAVAFFLVPVFLTLLLLCLRDVPSNPHNSIERFARRTGELPNQTDGLSARFERAKWCVTGGPFGYLIGTDHGKLRWIRRQFYVYETSRFLISAAVFMLGLWILLKFAVEWVMMTVGIILGSIAFLCQYRVHDQAADLLPLCFAFALVLGAALSKSFPRRTTRPRTRVAWGLFVATTIGTVTYSQIRPDYARGMDASGFLNELDVASMPHNSVIYAPFGEAAALWYAILVSPGRRDIQVYNLPEDQWTEDVEQHLSSPVFFIHPNVDAPPGWVAQPWRNVRRLVNMEDA